MMLLLQPATRLASRAVLNFSNKPIPVRQKIYSLNCTTHFRLKSTKHEPDIRTEENDSCVSVTFLRPDGNRVTVKANQDKSLYDAVIDNNVDIDGFGACEGTLCCTTCHLIFKQSDYEKVGEPSDEELDMLDLAYGLTSTSRLGCQVILKKELDPLEVKVPASINDVREG